VLTLAQLQFERIPPESGGYLGIVAILLCFNAQKFGLRNNFSEMVHLPCDHMFGEEELRSVSSRIDRDNKRHIENIRKLLMQPSSSQENIGLEDCAELVAKMYRGVGCDKVEVVRTKGSPIVYGECRGDADRTLLVYFMYDTMPYNEPGWTSPPMGAKIVDMKLPVGKVKALMNRGAYNTKGPMVAFLNSVEACTRSVGRPPVNLMFVAEGEEELGSPNLAPYVKKEKKRLSRADACYFPDFAQDADGSLNLYLGVKGVVYFELECSGKSWGRGPQEFAVHSANKAWLDSPVWRLVHALGTMTTEDGNRVLIDGFYDDVAPPSEDDLEVIRAAAKSFNPKATKDAMAVRNFMIPEDDKEELIKLYTYSSTLNIDGIWGGWIEKGSKTVLPHKATCKIDIRVVPNQKKDKMMPLVRKHLDKHGYSDIKMTEIDTGYDWCRSSVKEPVVQSLIRAMRRFYGEPNIWPTSGGSLPLFAFNRILKLPIAMGGLGYGDLAHSPNEFMVVEGRGKLAGLPEIEKSMVYFMSEFARGS